MHWSCERGCGAGGERNYPSERDARRYASALDREDRDDLGRRAPLFGLLPLRLGRAAMNRRSRRRDGNGGD